MEGFNWDEIKQKLESSVKIDKNDDEKSVKIIILEADVEQNQMVGGMLKGEAEMKQSLGQFLGKKEPLECDIEINQDEKYILMKFPNKKDYKKVYKLLNDMFFGDFFKKMLEAMMGAFKNFGAGTLDMPMGQPDTLEDEDEL